jgi:transcriptional regulator with XRE-family HTH domain
MRQMNYNFEAIGERIKQERKAAKLSQQELLEKVGYSRDSRQAIRDWESGSLMPELTIMLKLCNIFNCEIGYLLCEYDCKKRENTDICKVIHLSEQSVENIKQINSGILDAILKNDKVFELFQYLYAYYLDKYIPLNKFQRKFQGDSDEHNLNEDELNQYIHLNELAFQYGLSLIDNDETAEHHLYLACETLKIIVRNYSQNAIIKREDDREEFVDRLKKLRKTIELKMGEQKNGHDSET